MYWRISYLFIKRQFFGKHLPDSIKLVVKTQVNVTILYSVVVPLVRCYMFSRPTDYDYMLIIHFYFKLRTEASISRFVGPSVCLSVCQKNLQLENDLFE